MGLFDNSSDLSCSLAPTRGEYPQLESSGFATGSAVQLSLLQLRETVTVEATRVGVAPGLFRKFGQAQQEPDCCIGGHLLVPYEQYTQQSPGFGLSNALQCSHS